MKSIVVKLMLTGLLVAVLFIVCPQVRPLVNQVFTPDVVYQPKPVLPPPGVKYLEKVENLVVEMTNRARRAKGLAPLLKDDELTDVARAYSDDMLVRRFFDHTTPEGEDFDERISNHYRHRVSVVGENIWSAFGYYPGNLQQLAQEIVADWMNSPDHRANLLDPDFTHLGVGVSVRHHTIRVTQEFVGRFKGFNLGDFLTPRPIAVR